MAWTKIKIVIVLVLGIAGFGSGLLTYWMLVQATPPAVEARPAGDEAKEARMKPGDRLYVDATNLLRDAPLKGVCRVEPAGTLPLGPTYGRVPVGGLTIETGRTGSAPGAGNEQTKEPHVQVTWYDPVAHGGTNGEVKAQTKPSEKLMALLKERLDAANLEWDARWKEFKVVRDAGLPRRGLPPPGRRPAGHGGASCGSHCLAGGTRPANEGDLPDQPSPL